MKIFYVHTGDLEGNSPSSTFVLNRVRGLVKNNVEVILIIKKSSDRETEEILKNKFYLDRIPEGLKIFRIKEQKNIVFFKRAKEILKKEYREGDILYTRAIGVLPYLYSFSKKVKAKIFFETHDFFIDLKHRNDIKKRTRLKQSLVEKIFLKKMNGLVCVSESQARVYSKYLSIPILASHCGVIDNFKSRDNSENIMAYIGSIDERKGIKKIIYLMEKLDDNFKLIIFGGKNKEEIEKFQKIISEKKLENRVEITGWVDKKTLNERLKDVKLGLIPLNNMFFNRELIYPLKLVDYFAHRIPILINDYNTTQEYLKEGETGYFADWDNPDKCAERIRYIFNNSEIIPKLRSGVEEYLKEKNAEKNAAKLIEFFNK